MNNLSARSVAMEANRLGCLIVAKTWGKMSERAGRSARAQDRALRLIGLGLKSNEIACLVRKQERKRGAGQRRNRDGRALTYAIQSMQSPRPERCGMGLILVGAR